MEKLSPLRLRLKQSIEWLKAHKEVQQKDIAKRMGMAEASFSRGLKRCDDKFDSEFVIKFHQATDEIFSIDWLLEGTGQMFADGTGKNNLRQSESTTSDILEIYAQRIRLVDDLRTTLKEELAEVRNMRIELQEARDAFRDATYRLSMILQNSNAEQPPLMAAES